jgi:hypothetical protein
MYFRSQGFQNLIILDPFIGRTSQFQSVDSKYVLIEALLGEGWSIINYRVIKISIFGTVSFRLGAEFSASNLLKIVLQNKHIL